MIDLKPKLKNISRSPEGGYTIIEGLVAMIMVSALMVAVAPVIVFSVGTRVQARRVELASQAARSYVDAVRSGELQAPEGYTTEDELTAAAFTECAQTDSDDLTYCNAIINNGLNGQFYCVDGDGDVDADGNPLCTSDSLTDMMVFASIKLPDEDPTDGQREYISQMAGADAETKADLGYRLDIKVYRASAFASEVKLARETPATMVNNAGLATRYSDGSEVFERPLFATVTDIGAGDSNKSKAYENMYDRLGGE